MPKTILRRLDEIQPSQLYISSEKLDNVVKNFPSMADSIEPIPIKKLDDQNVLVDGHTRALAAFLKGWAQVPVYLEYEELDWEAYEICIQWCKEEGIHTIADLRDRVISHKEYEKLWLGRCAKMQEDLKTKRELESAGLNKKRKV